MLVRLSGTNFRSFKNTFELSALAADLNGEGDGDRGVYEARIAGVDEPLRLLRVLAIYGPNASGKSSVLDAARVVAWMLTGASDAPMLWDEDEEIAEYSPFALSAESRHADTRLVCDVLHDDQILQYEVCYNRHEITRELLTLYSGSERVLIDRNAAGEIRGELIERSEANRLYVKGISKHVSVVAKLARFGPSDGDEATVPYRVSLLRALQWRSFIDAPANRYVRTSRGTRGFLPTSHVLKFADDPQYRNWIMQRVMTSADLGIKDVTVEKIDPQTSVTMELPEGSQSRRAARTTVVIEFVHHGENDTPLEFSEESSGTIKLFSIAPHLWLLSKKGGTLLADELGAGLHPTLLDRIVRDVNDVDDKSHAGQLIFTSHEPGLMEGLGEQVPALRRDQVFFCEKNSRGESELFGLTEFKGDARTVHNIRKRYLTGLYGALPLLQRMRL